MSIIYTIWDKEEHLRFVQNLAYNVDFCVVSFYSYIVCWVSGQQCKQLLNSPQTSNRWVFIHTVDVSNVTDNSIKIAHFTIWPLIDSCFHLSGWISHLKEERKTKKKCLSRMWNLQNLNWLSVAVSQELTPSMRCQEYSSNSAQSEVVVCQEVVRLLSNWLLISGTAVSSLQTHTPSL